jgi:hypothetical protein
MFIISCSVVNVSIIKVVRSQALTVFIVCTV